jgi:hypothetical protein
MKILSVELLRKQIERFVKYKMMYIPKLRLNVVTAGTEALSPGNRFCASVHQVLITVNVL